jgi:hypothetical protein
MPPVTAPSPSTRTASATTTLAFMDGGKLLSLTFPTASTQQCDLGDVEIQYLTVSPALTSTDATHSTFDPTQEEPFPIRDPARVIVIAIVPQDQTDPQPQPLAFALAAQTAPVVVAPATAAADVVAQSNGAVIRVPATGLIYFGHATKLLIQALGNDATLHLYNISGSPAKVNVVIGRTAFLPPAPPTPPTSPAPAPAPAPSPAPAPAPAPASTTTSPTSPPASAGPSDAGASPKK